MGMYTELVISTNIKNDPVAVAVIKHMLGMEEMTSIPDHKFFTTDRWAFMLKCSSYYFTPRNMNMFVYDDIGGYWCFISRSDFKNYDNEIELFINWLQPYIDAEHDPKQVIGYYRYEEDNEATFIYNKEKD